MSYSAVHTVLVFLLVVGVPLWDRYETVRLRASPTAASRIRLYGLSIGLLWSLTLVLVVTVPWHTLVTPTLSLEFVEGLRLHRMARALFWGILAGLGFGLVMPIIVAHRNEQGRAEMRKPFERIDFFLPASPRERWWFAGLSISAGVCEEIVYRGFLIAWLAAGPLGLAPVPAILIAAIVFGMAHGYQGWSGVVVTTVIALVMTVLFLVTGSLVLPIVLHILLDLRILLLWNEGEA